MLAIPYFVCEVSMQSIKASEDVISGILNCVCPECGGRMGGRGKEFKCQGQCQTDWRQTWELVSSARPDKRPQRALRPI